MRSGIGAVATGLLVIGLVASGCGEHADRSDTAVLEETTAAAGTTAAATSKEELQALVPTPANARETKGPDTIADDGIHLHFVVDGAPKDVVDAYKSALQDKGWDVTTIVTSTGDGGGGATYTATHGAAYSVIDGGGYDKNTYLNVCAWGSKPSDPNCSRDR